MDPELEMLITKQLDELCSLSPAALNVLEYLFKSGQPAPLSSLVMEVTRMAPRSFKPKSILNLRAGPGTNTPVLGMLGPDMPLAVLNQSMEWRQVFVPRRSQMGYVLAQYLDEVDPGSPYGPKPTVTLERILQGMVSMELLEIRTSKTAPDGWDVVLTRKGVYLASTLFKQLSPNDQQAQG